MNSAEALASIPAGCMPMSQKTAGVCHGSKRQTITRNYLNEAWAITAGPSSRPIEGQHLTALDAYSRQSSMPSPERLLHNNGKTEREG